MESIEVEQNGASEMRLRPHWVTVSLEWAYCKKIPGRDEICQPTIFSIFDHEPE